MRLAFHYHVPAMVQDGQILLPGYLGCFIDALAAELSELVCFLHTPSEAKNGFLDYSIRSPNVRLVNIGRHCSVPRRQLLSRQFCDPLRSSKDKLDAILLRGPSPLLPAMATAARPLPTILLLVGDYVAGSADLPQPPWRRRIITAWSNWNKWRQERVANRSLTFVNSRKLYDEMQARMPNLRETRTTTLNEADFFVREDTCQRQPYRLLYAGRMDQGKGLLDIGEAVALLASKGVDVALDLVGWPEKGDMVLEDLHRLAQERGIAERVKYLGFKSVGPELFQCYRNADLFVVASRSSEGFPRTIWEAMAHSVPVVATKVGSIPHFIEDAAVLVPPSDPVALANAIESLIRCPSRRQKLITSGRGLASEVTLEKQVGKMVRDIKNWMPTTQ